MTLADDPIALNLAREQLRHERRRPEAALDPASEDRLAHPAQEHARYEARRDLSLALQQLPVTAYALVIAFAARSLLSPLHQPVWPLRKWVAALLALALPLLIATTAPAYSSEHALLHFASEDPAHQLLGHATVGLALFVVMRVVLSLANSAELIAESHRICALWAFLGLLSARSNERRHNTLVVDSFRTYPTRVTGRSRLLRVFKRIVAVTLSLFLVSGCVTTISYTPTVPHEAKSRDAAFEVKSITSTPGPSVLVAGQYRLEQEASLGFPSLAPSTAPPCSGGIAASALGLGTRQLGENVAKSGGFYFYFPQDSTLLREPTVLDIPVQHSNGEAPTCLRVPIVEQRATPEWTRFPSYSLGMGFQLLVPFRRVYDVSAVPLLAFRGGPWIGPLRLRLDIAWGGAAAKASNPNLIGYAYGAGLLADTLFYSKNAWGLGVAAGYDVTAVSFDTNVDKLSHQGAGYRGLMHGPRWGLLLELLGDPAVGPAFKRRRDSESITLEVFGAAEWSTDHSAATPALWFALSGDLGNR